MRFVQINEHSVGVFSQRPTNKFCGYFAELEDGNSEKVMTMKKVGTVKKVETVKKVGTVKKLGTVTR